MVTPLQKQTAQAIVNIFETGRVQGDYGQVTLLPGDTGHLTYGRSQTTLGSGNLALLIRAYCEAPDAELASALAPYLVRLAQRDTSLDHDRRLRRLLKEAGEDPVMREVQDHFFDRVYWAPCVRAASTLGISTGLGTAVVYDSHIHGSWRRMRDRTVAQHGPATDLGEQVWIEHYVHVRREWLAGHTNRLLRRTVYRMDAFRSLISVANWALDLPIRVCGVVIDEETLVSPVPVRVSALDEEERALRLQTPPLQGEDVRAVQQALAQAGCDPGAADGVFGPRTAEAVRHFQRQHDLTVDGIVGPATRAALGL